MKKRFILYFLKKNFIKKAKLALYLNSKIGKI